MAHFVTRTKQVSAIMFLMLWIEIESVRIASKVGEPNYTCRRLTRANNRCIELKIRLESTIHYNWIILPCMVRAESSNNQKTQWFNLHFYSFLSV